MLPTDGERVVGSDNTSVLSVSGKSATKLPSQHFKTARSALSLTRRNKLVCSIAVFSSVAEYNLQLDDLCKNTRLVPTTITERPTSRIQSCCSACSGVILSEGLHSRHLRMKSKNSMSLVLRADAKSRVSGRRFRPLELVMQRGFPLESVRISCVCVCV